MIKTLFPDLNFIVPEDGEYGTGNRNSTCRKVLSEESRLILS